jgi:4-azaleucine resistance transporter AzlC
MKGMVIIHTQLKSNDKIIYSVWSGVKQAFPIMLGCVPIGIAYGVLAQQTKLGLWPTLGLSLFVFAGASQFMAVSMMHNGINPGAIIGATFIVNIRHVLMSASIAPYLSRWKIWQRVLLGGMLTDETFIMHSLNFGRGAQNLISAYSLNFAFYLTWATSGMVGYNLGAAIANPEAWGLDFALPAMFVGLLLSACKNKIGAIAAIVGGVISVGLHLVGAESWAAFLGALGGATIGVLFCMKEGAGS